MYEYPVDDPESEYCVTDGTSFSRNGISWPVFRALDLGAVQVTLGDGGLGVGAHRRDDHLLREARNRAQHDLDAGERAGDLDVLDGREVGRLGHAQDVPPARKLEREAPVGASLYRRAVRRRSPRRRPPARPTPSRTMPLTA